jgi:hypothetical protein
MGSEAPLSGVALLTTAVQRASVPGVEVTKKPQIVKTLVVMEPDSSPQMEEPAASPLWASSLLRL